MYYDSQSQQIVDLRGLLSLRGRLKKEEHSLRMCIRNTLLVFYFPELDKYYRARESESLAIIRWCLNPDKIVLMEFDQVFKLVTRAPRGIAQKLRIHKIHQDAVNSVGCPMGQSAEFEAKLLVKKLDHVRQHIRKTEDLIEDICIDYP